LLIHFKTFSEIKIGIAFFQVNGLQDALGKKPEPEPEPEPPKQPEPEPEPETPKEQPQPEVSEDQTAAEPEVQERPKVTPKGKKPAQKNQKAKFQQKPVPGRNNKKKKL